MLGALVCVLIWTATPTIVKIGLNYSPPLTIAAGRFTVGALALMPLLWKRYGGISGFRTIPRKFWVRLVLMGICAHLFGDGFEYLGLTMLPASTVGFLAVLIPLVPIFISIVWMKEKPTVLQYLGMAIVLAGTLVFLYPFEIVVNKPIGLMFILLSLIGIGIYNLFSRYTSKNHELSTLAITAFPMFFGGICLWILVLMLEGLPQFSWPGLVLILWLGLVNSVTAFMLYNHAFKYLSIVEMSALIGLLPITSGMLPAIILKEPIAWYQVAAMVVVVLGAIIVQVKNRSSAA